MKKLDKLDSYFLSKKDIVEIKNIFKLLETEDGTNIPFTAFEYVRAATCCELTRVYGNGGDDELSVRLGDLSITNKNLPRNTLSRANATTWCQIAAMLRKEMLTSKVGMIIIFVLISLILMMFF